MKLTKQKIDELAHEILTFFIDNQIDECSIYYNGKQLLNEYIYENGKCIETKIVERDFENPYDHLKCLENHIMTLDVDGALWQCFNYTGKHMDDLSSILEKYGLYYEQYTECCINLVKLDGDYSEVEYIDYSQYIIDPISLSSYDESFSKELIDIARAWEDICRFPGEGRCVFGGGLTFFYEDKKYLLNNFSFIENELITNAVKVRNMIEAIGGTKIEYEYGLIN